MTDPESLIEQIKQAGHEVSETMHFGDSDYPVKAIPYAKFIEVLSVFEATYRAEARASVVATSDRPKRWTLNPSRDDGYELAWIDDQHRTQGWWISADDARALAAGVVAEEPEWEYGEQSRLDPNTVWTVDPDSQSMIWADIPAEKRVRRRAAGEWVPVKQEGRHLQGPTPGGLDLTDAEAEAFIEAMSPDDEIGRQER